MKTIIHFLDGKGKRLCGREVPTFVGTYGQVQEVHVSTTNHLIVNCRGCINAAFLEANKAGGDEQ